MKCRFHLLPVQWNTDTSTKGWLEDQIETSSNSILVLLTPCNSFYNVTKIWFACISNPAIDTDLNKEHFWAQAIQPQISDFINESDSLLPSERGITHPESRCYTYRLCCPMIDILQVISQEWIDLLCCLSIWKVTSLCALIPSMSIQMFWYRMPSDFARSSQSKRQLWSSFTSKLRESAAFQLFYCVTASGRPSLLDFTWNIDLLRVHSACTIKMSM